MLIIDQLSAALGKITGATKELEAKAAELDALGKSNADLTAKLTAATARIVELEGKLDKATAAFKAANEELATVKAGVSAQASLKAAEILGNVGGPPLAVAATAQSGDIQETIQKETDPAKKAALCKEFNKRRGLSW